jgi:hypothetical protein
VRASLNYLPWKLRKPVAADLQSISYLEGEEARSDRSRDQVNGTFGVFA